MPCASRTVGQRTSRVRPSQHQARGTRLRDRPPIFVGDFTLHVAHGLSSSHHFALGSQLRLPHWSEEINLQLHGRERFRRCQSAIERDAHGRVSDVAQDSAMQRTHRIGMLRPSHQRYDSAAVSYLHQLKPNELPDRHSFARPRHQRMVALRIFRRATVLRHGDLLSQKEL